MQVVDGELEGDAYDWLTVKKLIYYGSADDKFLVTADPYRYVISANIQRRHLTAEQKRELIGKLLKAEPSFRAQPPTLCAVFAERVPLCKRRWEPDDTTATAYCWLVWMDNAAPRPLFWIPPRCREKLTRPDDVVRFTTHPVAKRLPLADVDDLDIPAYLRRMPPGGAQ